MSISASAIIAKGVNWSVVARVHAENGVVLTYSVAGHRERIALTPQEMNSLCAMWENVQPDNDNKQEGDKQ